MKLQRQVILFIVLIAALVALLWHAKNNPQGPLATSAEAAGSESPKMKSSPSSPARDTNTPRSVTASLSNQSVGKKAERMQGVLTTYNDVPIDFYGKLEDQFGKPVAGATIKGSVMLINGVREGSDLLTANSDASGLFQFHGRGQEIGMMPSKEGYTLASTGTVFKYSHLEDHPYVSDVNNPTVIKMWKLGGAEPLLSINQKYKLPYTKEPIMVDLLAGEVVPTGGDIKLIVNRSEGIISGRNRLDWSVEIEAVNGGLIDSGGQDRVTYAAPDSGYQPNMTLIFSTNAPYKWFGGFNQGFFLNSRNGQIYSKLGLSFNINNQPDGLMTIIFSGVANTNGSRNWEGDPNTFAR